MIDPLSDDNDIEGDLMAAMNAALEDGSDSNMGLLDGDDDDDDDDLLSVDVVGEAMNLLMTSESNSEAGDGEIEDLDGLEQEKEEEISFEDFMAGKATIDDGEDDDGNDDEEIETSEMPTEKSNGEEPAPSGDSPDSPDDSSPAVDNDPGSGGADTNCNGKGNTAHEPIASVPLQQFENALALIQDLENRVLILETDRQCLVEENSSLKEETLAQATMLATLEAKLAEFPKLLQQTVDEEAKLAAAKAEAETKFSFWKKDMDRQEKELEEEKRKRSRNHAATTDSLVQSDFLKDVVERKEQEEKTAGGVAAVAGGLLSKVTGPLQNSQSKAQNGVATSDPADGNNNHNNNSNSNSNSNNTPQSPKRKGPFGFLRGWGGGKNKENNDKDETDQDGEGDTPDETTGEGSDDIRGSERDLATSNSHDSSGSAGGFLDGEDDANEMMTIVHDKHNPDDKMLGLLT